MPAALAEPPSLLERWWALLRPGRFWLSLWPLILGTIIAWFGSSKSFSSVFHPIRLVVFVLAVLAIHAGANLLNEYYDVQRGTDVERAPGTSGVLQKGLLSEETVQRAGLVSLAAGALAVLIVVLVAHAWSALILGGAAVLLAYLYSATPYALGYWWLGELVIGFVMGPAIVISSVQLQGAQVGSLAITFSLALGAFAAAVTLVKNLRDVELDRAAHKRTLATLLGSQVGRTLYLALVLLPYLFVVVVAFPHGRPHGVLFVLLTAAELVVVISGILRAEAPAATNVVVAQTMRLHWRFSLCLLVGYLLSIAVVALTGFLGI
jgi:1,4-dihydroxy-2-naphthoate octaprenyltransferase